MDILLDYLHWDIDIRRAHMHDRRPPERARHRDRGGQGPRTRRRADLSAFVVEHDPVRPAFGYRFEGGGRSVVVSGDTKPCENLMKWSRGVDVLIHECCEMTKTGWSRLRLADAGGEDPRPPVLSHAARRARPRGRRRPGPRLVVSHLMPGSVPEELRAAAARDYAGPVVIGEDLLEV